MNSEIKIGVAGGDERQLITARALADVGFEVAVFGFGSTPLEHGGITRCTDLCGVTEHSRAVILPLPVSRDRKSLFCPLGAESEKGIPLSRIFELSRHTKLVLGGSFDDAAASLAAKNGVHISDYYLCDEVGIFNAVPSAEGALAIAIEESPVTVYGSDIHILGFGRIGKVLARSLYSLGASVTVHSRSPSDMAWSRVLGYHSTDITRLSLSEHPFDRASVVFNTVPARIISKAVLDRTEKSTLIIDLASSPGGADPSDAERCGIKYVRALSLPAKTAPLSSGKILCDSIFSILHSEGISP